MSDALLLLLKCCPELGCVLDFLTTRQDLRVHGFDLFFEHTFLLLGLKELVRPDLKCINRCVLVSLSLLFLSFELGQIVIRHAAHRLGFEFELLFELLELDLIFA